MKIWKRQKKLIAEFINLEIAGKAIMPRKSFLDALSDISQIKSLEKFTKTRDMVRSGQDITSLSMSDLSRDGLLNPWILNIQEVINIH